MKILSSIINEKDITSKEYVDGEVSEKQDTLVSGTNIKTINNTSLLGSGNISVGDKVAIITYGENILFSTIKNYVDNEYAVFCEYTIPDATNKYELIPLCRIEYPSKGNGVCVFESFTGNGKYICSIELSENVSGTPSVEDYGTWNYSEVELQEKLVSGTNIRTVNGVSLLASGGLTVGTIRDVRMNNSSIVNNDIANIITNTAYNASTNKIATMSDIPTFVTTDETLCSGTSLNPNSQIAATDKSITKSGYKPLGIMGYSMTGTNHQSTNIVILDLTASNDGSGTIQYRFRNLSASATATITLTAKVLWLKV